MKCKLRGKFQNKKEIYDGKNIKTRQERKRRQINEVKRNKKGGSKERGKSMKWDEQRNLEKKSERKYRKEKKGRKGKKGNEEIKGWRKLWEEMKKEWKWKWNWERNNKEKEINFQCK